MKIKYRLAEEKDVEAMASFWSLNSGWDIIDASEWDRRFKNGPSGPSVVAVAENGETNQIIGQFIFIPVSFWVNDEMVRSYRPFAPILDSNLQSSFGIGSLLTGKHPMLRLYKVITAELKTRGINFVYYIPDPRWSRVLQAFPSVSTHSFPLWSRPLTSDMELKNKSLITTRKINTDDPVIDGLWEKSKNNYPVWIPRNTANLRWKSFVLKYSFYGVFRNGEAIGIFGTAYKKNDHQWLIYDVLTQDNNGCLSATLTAACSTINEENNQLQGEDSAARKISILATPLMESILSESGFKKDKYNFTLAVHRLNNDQIPASDHPSKWYVSAND